MKLKKLLPFVIGLLVFFGMAGNLVSMIVADKLSEISTVEKSAIFESAECVDSGKGISWMIHVKEPNGTLMIPTGIGDQVDRDAIHALQAGQPIFFRMDLSTAEQYQQSGTAGIVALKAEQELLSLEDYNCMMHQLKKPALTAGVIFEAALCLLLVYLARKNKVFALLRRRHER